MIAAYTGWIDKRNDPKKAVVFGNGQQLPESAMEELIAYMEKMQCVYRWNAGQFVIVDNSMTYHARQALMVEREECWLQLQKEQKQLRKE